MAARAGLVQRIRAAFPAQHKLLSDEHLCDCHPHSVTNLRSPPRDRHIDPTSRTWPFIALCIKIRVSTLGNDDPEAKRPERAPEPSHDARPAGNDLSPFQGEPLLGWFPGLKPWAEFSSPFGAIDCPKQTLT